LNFESSSRNEDKILRAWWKTWTAPILDIRKGFGVEFAVGLEGRWRLRLWRQVLRGWGSAVFGSLREPPAARAPALKRKRSFLLRAAKTASSR
jgi:hypothetical protein